MAVPQFQALKPLARAIAVARGVSLCSLALWSSVLAAQELAGQEAPYAAGSDGDMFHSSERYQASAENLDWVDASDMTEAQRTGSRQGCCGAYIAPQRNDSEANLDPEGAPVRASADQSRWLQQSQAELTGNVELLQGSRSLSADRVVVNQAARTAEIEGHVVVRQPGLLMLGDRLSTDEVAGTAVLQNARFVLHDAHLRGQAQVLEQRKGKSGQDSYGLTDGSFTQCEPDNNGWMIRGSSITIDTETGQGVARDMRLEVADVPVFYAPYFRFPATDKRMTGLLFPSVGIDSRNGFEYAQPVYFNLAPNYDLTVTPRYLQNRGTALEAEVRHLSPLFSTVAAGAYLSNDDGGDNDNLQAKADAGEITQAEVTPYLDEDRWIGSLQQTGGIGQAWRTTIDYTQISDVDYLRDLDSKTVEVNSTTHLLQKAELGYNVSHWQLALKAEAYQTVAANQLEPYRQLPRLDINGSYDLGEGLALSLQHNYTNFTHRDAYWDQSAAAPSDLRIVGERLRADYQLQWDQQWLWGYLRPALMVKHLQYALDEERLRAGAEVDPSITGAQASLDAGLFFERDGSLFSRDYVQTFEPRVFYFNSPYQDHQALYGVTDKNRSVSFDTSALTFSYDQLFRSTRFNGADRIDDANQLSLGLTSRFLEGDTGVERLSLSAGQIFYFTDRRVTLSGAPEQSPRSAIAGQLSAQISSNWRYSVDAIYSQEIYKLSQGSTSLRYANLDGVVFNLGYRYQRGSETTDPQTGELYDTSISQTDVSIVYPIGTEWNLLARSFHDQTLNREIETFAGIEYDSCCYRLRLLARRWTDSRDLSVVGPANLEVDRGIFFEFQLKGLGTVGRSLDKMLSTGIVGFNQRPQYNP